MSARGLFAALVLSACGARSARIVAPMDLVVGSDGRADPCVRLRSDGSVVTSHGARFRLDGETLRFADGRVAARIASDGHVITGRTWDPEHDPAGRITADGALENDGARWTIDETGTVRTSTATGGGDARFIGYRPQAARTAWLLLDVCALDRLAEGMANALGRRR